LMYEHDSAGRETPRLEDYLLAIRRRRILVIGIVLLGVVAAIVYGAKRTEHFTATARVLVGPTPVGSVQDNRLEAPSLERAQEVIASNRVVEAARANGLSGSRASVLRTLDVSFLPDSDVLRLSSTTEDARKSAEIANAVATAYVALREDDALAFYGAGLEQVAQELATLDSEVAEVTSRLEALPTTAQSERNSLNTQLNQLLIRRRDVDQAGFGFNQATATRAPAAEVLALADVPETPDGFSDTTLTIIGGILGLVFGIAAAFIADRLDRTARDGSDTELALGVPAIGSVPSFGIANRNGASALVMLSAGKSRRLQRAREAFRRLRTSVSYLGVSDGVSTILVTSARPGEGKSVTAANLAVALAHNGSTVALVSADMRRPALEELFSVSDPLGLSGYLESRTDVPVSADVGVANLSFFPAGPTPANPGVLLGSDRFGDLVNRLSAQHDLVIIDSPPLGATADAASAARFVDGVIVVVDTRRTDTPSLLRARGDLSRVGARILGAVLNREKDLDEGFTLRPARYRYRYAYEKKASEP